MNTQKNISQKVYEHVQKNIRDQMDEICLQFFSSIVDMLRCIDASIKVDAGRHVQEQFRMERENAARQKRSSKRRV